MKTEKKNTRRLLKCFALFVFLVNFGAVSFQTIDAQENKEQTKNKKAECDECCDECRDKFIITCPSPPTLVAKFDYLSTHEWEMGQIDNLLMQMQNNPDADGIIVVYGGRINKYGEFEIRTKRIKNYIEYRKFEMARVKIVHGGFRKKFEFELWISPLENSYPPLSPTIAPEKVKFIGTMKPFGP